MHISYIELKKSTNDINKLRNIVVSLLDADIKFYNNEYNEIIKDNANIICDINSIFIQKMPINFAMYFVDNLYEFPMWKEIINDLHLDLNLTKLILHQAIIKNNYKILDIIDISDLSQIKKLINNNKMIEYLQNKQKNKDEKRDLDLKKKFDSYKQKK